MNTVIDAARRMVPRWRPASIALRQGELASAAASDRALDMSSLLEVALGEPIRDWESNRDFGHAADLVCAASVLALGALPDAVRSAAMYVLREDDSSRPIRRIAARLLGETELQDGGETPESEAAEIGLSIRARRAALRRFPQNPLVWTDLARDFASTGSSEAAFRAMRAAIGLAPDNRFVLRSFTRLALHLRTVQGLSAPSEALDRLRRSPAVAKDPWLVAAEIAASMVLDKSPRRVRVARELLERGDFPAFHLSELAGALASLEIDSGSIRRGRKLLDRALVAPTDNVVAQAAWTARRIDSTPIDPKYLKYDFTFEARAFEHFQGGRWPETLGDALAWHADEPFASRPLILAGFVAGVAMADFDRCARITREGLRVNPNEQTLRNNLAFALASDGKIEAAYDALRRLPAQSVSADVLPAYTATWGLIAFRAGLPELGRQLYELAIRRAKVARNASAEAIAVTFLAREERFAGTADASAAFIRAQELAKKLPLHTHLATLQEHVRTTPFGGAKAALALGGPGVRDFPELRDL